MEINGTSYYRAILGSNPWSLVSNEAGNIQTFEVRSGDKGYEGDFKSGNERAELVTADPWQTGRLVPFDRDYWLSFAFKVDSGPAITARFSICGQFHDFKDRADKIGLSPPLCFVLGRSIGDKIPYMVHARFDPQAASTENPKPYTLWSSNLSRGAFHNFVVRVRFNYDRGGEFDLWLDGHKKASRRQVSIGYNHSSADAAGYWQYGIYREGSEDRLRVHYANMEQSFASLAQRIDRPLPI